MDKNDEYRKFAREAQDLADRSRNDTGRASWLRIAQSWLKLLRPPIAKSQHWGCAGARRQPT